jgi:chromosome segregation ATPase
MNEELYKIFEERDEKIFKKFQVEMEKAIERITTNLRLLLVEQEKVSDKRINEVENKINNVNFRCSELERNCSKCESGMQQFKNETRNKLEEFSASKNQFLGATLITKFLITSGVLGILYAVGKFMGAFVK